jgi:hypothetical protein
MEEVLLSEALDTCIKYEPRDAKGVLLAVQQEVPNSCTSELEREGSVWHSEGEVSKALSVAFGSEKYFLGSCCSIWMWF